MNRVLLASAFALSVSLVSRLAPAHVDVSSGPAFAGTTQEVSFGVGHGCEGLDTHSVRIEIPAQAVSVRAVGSTLGAPSMERDDAGLVTAVTWTKPAASVEATDSSYYRLTLRFRVPDQPFSKLYFPARQVCRDEEGAEIVVDWISTEPGDAAAEPAPALTILPKRFSGWNKFTLSTAISELAVFFSDALIVWKGDAAYSANPLTAELISDTDDVTALSELEAGDEIWVKY